MNFRGANRIDDVIIDAHLTLAIWVVLALVCGIYLLGLFRTDHDFDEVRVGPGRMVMGVLFLSLALYLAPALFGNPPRNGLYAMLSPLLPPGAAKSLDANDQLATRIQGDLQSQLAGISLRPDASDPAVAASAAPRSSNWLGAQEATSSDPEKALREERTFHGVSWGLSYEAALEEAKAKNLPVLIDFTGVNCVNCRKMEDNVMPRKVVVDALHDFVTVQLYTDTIPIKTLEKDKAQELAEDNLAMEFELVNQTTSPHYAILDPSGQVLAQRSYDPDPDGFASFLKGGLEKFRNGSAASQASQEKPAPTRVTSRDDS
jgi:thiol:disulfide interchange protein DsbD